MQNRFLAKRRLKFLRHSPRGKNDDSSRSRGIGPKNLQLIGDLAFIGNDHAQRRSRFSALGSQFLKFAGKAEPNIVALKRGVADEHCIRDGSLAKQMELICARSE